MSGSAVLHPDRQHFVRTRAVLELRGAVPSGSELLAGRLSWVGSPRGKLPLPGAARLGGLLKLSGFATGQPIGDDVTCGHLRPDRTIGRAPLGLRDGWPNSVAACLGGEASLGPVFVGIGRGSGDSLSAYLVIGVP